MEDISGTPKDLYIHDNVTIANPNNPNDSHVLGTLKIVHYENVGNFIEWRPLEVSVDSETHDEWNVVNTKEKYKSSPGGSTTSNENSRYRPIRIELCHLKSLKIKNHGKHLILSQDDGQAPNTFIFINENIDSFIRTLHSHIKLQKASKDMYIVNDETRNDPPDGFVGLELENTSDYVWKFVHNLHSRPYETTLQAFSKLTDLFLNPSKSRELRFMTDEVNEFLSKSLTGSFEETSLPLSGEDYEMVNKVEKLPPRTECPRGTVMTLEQWNSFKDAEGRITDPQTVKKMIFRGGLSDSIRKEVWKYLLNFYQWNMTSAEIEQLRQKRIEEYYQMKFQWQTISKSQEDRFSYFRERKSLIEKDVNRTDRTNEYFAGENNANLKLLYDILMTYVMYNFDLGYVQGMSDLLSPVLTLMQVEVDAFWCFVGLMERVKCNFDLDQAGMKKQLDQLYCLLKITDQELLNYLIEHESENMFFCFRWLLILFKREFTYTDTLYLWEVLFTDHLSNHFHLFVCLAILDTEKSKIIENKYGFTEILKHINDLSLYIDVQQVLATAESIFLQMLALTTPLPDSIRSLLGLKPLNLIDTSKQNNEEIAIAGPSNTNSKESKQSNSQEINNTNNAAALTSNSNKYPSIYFSHEDSYEQSVSLNFL